MITDLGTGKLLEGFRFKPQTMQLIMVLIISLGSFIMGCTNGWVSPALVKLQSEDSPIKITSAEGSKLALYPEFAHFVTPMIAGIVADKIGRKPVFILSNILVQIGWTIKLFAGSLKMLLVARFLLGLNFGVQSALMNIYVAEISSKTIRGTFGSILFIAMNLGILFQFVIGTFLSLKTIALITTLICILQFVFLLFLLESPYFLATGNVTKAKLILHHLRGPDSEDIDEELNTIVKRTSAKMELSSSVVKSFVLCFVLSFMSDLTGRGAILAYATQNFSSQGYFSAGFFTILLGCLNVLLPFIPTLLSDKVGRKVIIIVAAAIGGTMHLCSGLLYYVHDSLQQQIPMYGWLIFTTITGYLCSCSVFSTNILLLRGELISENNRGVASGIVSKGYAFSILVTIKTFQVVRDYCGLYVSFWLLSVFSFIFVTITAMFLPETKGKSFDEIQRIFGRK